MHHITFQPLPLPMWSNWWDAGHCCLDFVVPKTGTDVPQTNFFCKTKVSGEKGKKRINYVEGCCEITWGTSQKEAIQPDQTSGRAATSIPRNQCPTHSDPALCGGKDACKYSSPPGSAGSSALWCKSRKEPWYGTCATSSAVRTEEQLCWLLSLKLYSCRYGGKNMLWGKCPGNWITQLTVPTMPVTPLFGKDSGKSRIYPEELQASKQQLRSAHTYVMAKLFLY